MVPTLDIDQRVLVNRLGRESQHRRRRRLPSAPRRRPPGRPVCGDPNQGRRTPRQACDTPTPQESSQTFVKRVVGRSRRRHLDRQRPRDPQRQSRRRTPTSCPAAPSCNFPNTDQDSARRLLHDGRQPWRTRTTAASGDRSRANGSSVSRSSPTGRRTGSASSSRVNGNGNGAVRRRKAPARPARSCSSSTGRWVCASSRAPTRPAGDAWPDRSWPPPCCSTSSGSGRARSARSGRSTTPSSRRAEGRAELFPVILRIAAKVAIVSRCAPGIDARGLHMTNLAALRDALSQVACEGCMCLSDGFPVAGARLRPARGESAATPRAPRSPRRR